MSRPRANESLEQSFIKLILTKNQGRSKKNKKEMWIRKSRYIKLDRTYCCTKKFNTAFSLCKALEITLYFSKGFLEAAVRRLAVAETL